MNEAMRKNAVWLGLALCASATQADESRIVDLPVVQRQGGMPLMQALSERHSTREFGPGQLSRQTLSNLLWAAFGINRSDGHRTAPSTRNWQSIDVYVALPDGLYLYEAAKQALRKISAQDIRAATGTQDFVKDAYTNLVYVADFSRMDPALTTEDKKIAAAADAGFIGQNVYLFCASEGLATVVRGSIDHAALTKAMGLKPSQWIVLAQSVGNAKAEASSPATEQAGSPR